MFFDTLFARRVKFQVRARRRRAGRRRCGPPCRPMRLEPLEDRRLLALGGAVEVMEPLPLRRAMADYGRQIVARYSGDARRTADDKL